MATGFRFAGDVIRVHGQRKGDNDLRPRGGPAKEYQSLPAGSFLLAFAAGEAEVKRMTSHYGIKNRQGRPMGLGSEGLVAACAAHGVTLRARARVVPQPGSKAGVHRWILLDGQLLDAYLRDAYSIRNSLAHEGSTAGARLQSGYFAKGGATTLRSMTLMLAEGFLQAAQDVAFLARGSRPSSSAWEWVEPPRSQASRMSATLRRHPDFPLPAIA
jgi:hypothetical protein